MQGGRERGELSPREEMPKGSPVSFIESSFKLGEFHGSPNSWPKKNELRVCGVALKLRHKVHFEIAAEAQENARSLVFL